MKKTYIYYIILERSILIVYIFMIFCYAPTQLLHIYVLGSQYYVYDRSFYNDIWHRSAENQFSWHL